MLPGRLVLFACAALLGGGAPSAVGAQDGALAITAAPLPLNESDPEIVSAGLLVYRGGLVLTSAEERFGGISGLRWLGEGNRFLAVTDQGDWLTFDTAEKEGRLTGIRAARIGRLTDERGAPLITKELADAEALTIVRPEGRPATANIYFERLHRGSAYALTEAGGIGEWRRDIAMGDWVQKLPANGGLEAVAGTPHGRFLIPEELRGPSGRALAHRVWIEDGKIRDRIIGFELPEAYKPTDAHALPDGSILLLSRRFSAVGGLGMRIDRLTFTPGQEGAAGKLASEEIADLSPPFAIDNMEGIAVRTEGGRNYVYVVSDNNFRPIQRTVLLKFELREPKRQAPAAGEPAEGL